MFLSKARNLQNSGIHSINGFIFNTHDLCAVFSQGISIDV